MAIANSYSLQNETKYIVSYSLLYKYITYTKMQLREIQIWYNRGLEKDRQGYDAEEYRQDERWGKSQIWQ